MFFLKNNKLNPNELEKIESKEIDEIRNNYTVERIQKQQQMLVVGKKLIKLLILGEISKGRERQEGK